MRPKNGHLYMRPKNGHFFLNIHMRPKNGHFKDILKNAYIRPKNGHLLKIRKKIIYIKLILNYSRLRRDCG